MKTARHRNNRHELIDLDIFIEMEKIHIIANAIGISPGKIVKAEMIKRFQLEEGNFDCYATAFNRECDQLGCRWRDDCFEAACKSSP